MVDADEAGPFFLGSNFFGIMVQIADLPVPLLTALVEVILAPHNAQWNTVVSR